MLIDRRTLPSHVPWIVTCLVATAAASAWYFLASLTSSPWPGGSSVPGFTFGVLGSLIILFELLLWWRRKVPAWRVGRTQTWMRAHIWLGLLSVPLLIYHSGFRLGGSLSTVLMVVFLVVIASGVWGLVMQQFLPERLLNDVPAETLYAQRHHFASRNCAEAEQLVLAACGPAPGEKESPPAPEQASGMVLVVGASRAAAKTVRSTGTPVPGAELLRDFFRDAVQSYLGRGGASGSALARSARAARMFRDLRSRLDPAVHETVDALESLCEQRRQLDLQTRLYFWLHNWLWIHLPLSASLLVLMIWHACAALRYW